MNEEDVNEFKNRLIEIINFYKLNIICKEWDRPDNFNYHIDSDECLNLSIYTPVKLLCENCKDIDHTVTYLHNDLNINLKTSIVLIRLHPHMHLCDDRIDNRINIIMKGNDSPNMNIPIFPITKFFLESMFPATKDFNYNPSSAKPFGTCEISRGWVYCRRRNLFIPGCGYGAMYISCYVLIWLFKLRKYPINICKMIINKIINSYMYDIDIWDRMIGG